MSELETLADLFEHELKDVYDAEQQVIKALPEMIKAVSDTGLQEALTMHLEETEGQVGRLEEVFASINVKPTGQHCAGMSGILEEGNDLLAAPGRDKVLDVAFLAACQKVEHYEISAYGTLLAWAEILEYTEAIPLLTANEREEKAADMKLSDIAAAINPGAADDNEEDEDDEEDDEDSEEDEEDEVIADQPTPKNV